MSLALCPYLIQSVLKKCFQSVWACQHRSKTGSSKNLSLLAYGNWHLTDCWIVTQIQKIWPALMSSCGTSTDWPEQVTVHLLCVQAKNLPARHQSKHSGAFMHVRLPVEMEKKNKQTRVGQFWSYFGSRQSCERCRQVPTNRSTDRNTHTKQAKRCTDRERNRQMSSLALQRKYFYLFFCFRTHANAVGYCNKVSSGAGNDRMLMTNTEVVCDMKQRQHLTVLGQDSVLLFGFISWLFLTKRVVLHNYLLYFRGTVLFLRLSHFLLLLLVFLQCPLSFQLLSLNCHCFFLYPTSAQLYPLFFLPPSTLWSLNINERLAFKVPVTICASLFFCLCQSVCLALSGTKSLYFWSLVLFSNLLFSLFFTSCPNSLSLSLFLLHVYLPLILPSSFPLCWAPCSLCRLYFLHSQEEWDFLKFYQRRSAFSPRTLHLGYWRLQHGLLLCAALCCKL